MIKYYRLSWEFILWEISYVNLTMLLATIPTFEGLTDKESEKTTKHVESVTDLKKFLNL